MNKPETPNEKLNFKTVRNILFVLFPVLIATCFMCKIFNLHSRLVDWVYAISLSGLVGLGTNSLAIRMLFRPTKPTCFGKWRQGILPRHQADVADTIGEAAQKEIMNEENIRSYIEQSTIIENAINQICDFLTNAIESRAFRDIIHKQIIDLYNQHADIIFDNLLEKTDDAIVDFFSNKWNAKTFWKTIRPQLEKLFNKITLEKDLTEKVIDQLVDAAPHIARVIKNEIVKYVSDDETKNPWEWFKTKLTKHYVDDDKIKKILITYIRKKSFQKTILQYIDNNVNSLTDLLDSNKKLINSTHEWVKNQTRKIGKDKLIPYIKQKIDSYLNSDDSWESMDKYIHKSALFLIEKIPEFSNDPKIIAAIKKNVPELMQSIDFKSLVSEIIKKKDPQEFERLIRKATNKHLAAIEVLGGILGMVSGLALINKWFVILVPAALGLFILIEKIFTKNNYSCN